MNEKLVYLLVPLSTLQGTSWKQYINNILQTSEPGISNPPKSMFGLISVPSIYMQLSKFHNKDLLKFTIY